MECEIASDPTRADPPFDGYRGYQWIQWEISEFLIKLHSSIIQIKNSLIGYVIFYILIRTEIESSLIELKSSLIQLKISLIQLTISLIQLKISLIQLESSLILLESSLIQSKSS